MRLPLGFGVTGNAVDWNVGRRSGHTTHVQWRTERVVVRPDADVHGATLPFSATIIYRTGRRPVDRLQVGVVRKMGKVPTINP